MMLLLLAFLATVVYAIWWAGTQPLPHEIGCEPPNRCQYNGGEDFPEHCMVCGRSVIHDPWFGQGRER